MANHSQFNTKNMTGDDEIFSDLDRDAEDAIEAMNETAQEEFGKRQSQVSTATASELLAEYKRFNKLAAWHESRSRPKMAARCLDELPELATRMDQECEDAGIGVDAEGFPVFMNIGHGMSYGQPYYRSNREYVKLNDLHAIVERCMMKHAK